MKKSYVTDSYILNKEEFSKRPVKKVYPSSNQFLLCQDKQRQEINDGYCNYYKNTYVRSPCEYAKNVETEFYLRHGQNSHCCLQWKNRHNN